MSDRMQTVSFSKLLTWIDSEWKNNGSIFACNKVYYAKPEDKKPFLGRFLETPVGPAAGPHTQLAQNIVAAYVCGSRFFELKTVQKIDGEDLHVSKPCILAEDEGYNCEWSTELTVRQAFEEYVKAWVLLHYLAVEYKTGSPDGFVFNMSVGYDLEGIKSEKIDRFIEGMKDASETDIFRHCKEVLTAHISDCRYMTAEDVDDISPFICNNVSMSTMHGCPAQEIERIAEYLIREKGLSLYLKCNPTLLGYDYVRNAMDELGFDYIRFSHESFDHDLPYEEAIPMLRRLKKTAQEQRKEFGVKLTNTFPVKQLHGELPDETMYMSGRTLLPLSLKIAQRIGEEFDGEIAISYCGGINAQNVAAVYAAGITPVTVCTDLLKPGGYHRMNSIVMNLMQADVDFPKRIDTTEAGKMAESLCGRARPARGIRRKPRPELPEACANCRNVCGNCATLCPNRANVVIVVKEHRQLLHLDGPCNECGNCASFCPEGTAPYLEKMTLFVTKEALEDSKNSGFAPLNPEHTRFAIRWNGLEYDYELGKDSDAPEEITDVISAVAEQYDYLMYN